MRLIASVLSVLAVLAVPVVAAAHCSPQHVVQAPTQSTPSTGQQPQQTPIPGKTS